MCFVYVIQHGAVLGISGGLLTVRYPDGTEDIIPKNTIEGISVFSKAVITTQCIEFCLANNIRVGFFSQSGVYKGALTPVMYTNTNRLRRQVALSEDAEFSLAIARKIVSSKIRNQATIIRRYSYGNDYTHECIGHMSRLAKGKVPRSESINQIIGYEGIASRLYWNWLSTVVEDDFKFSRRNRRPAVDPFNCMLNFGYSILSKEIYGELENRYLNPYIGFMHKDKAGHPALASDLIEEWRPVIVDSTVLSLVQGHEVSREGFEIDGEDCRMTKDTIKLLLSKLELKMESRSQYLKYIDKPITFREAIWHQADRLSRAIDKGNPNIYMPVIIR